MLALTKGGGSVTNRVVTNAMVVEQGGVILRLYTPLAR